MSFEAPGKAPIEVGFNEVVLPDLWAKAAPRARPARIVRQPSNEPDRAHLLLRRGVTGALDLYRWLDEARPGGRRKADPARTVVVRLIAEDQATVVLSWRFTGARPVRVGWSPLRAQSAEIVIETLELSFARIDVE